MIIVYHHIVVVCHCIDIVTRLSSHSVTFRATVFFALQNIDIPYSRLFTQVATFVDVFNVQRAGYFSYCIIHIIPHEQHQTILATSINKRVGAYRSECVRIKVVINCN